MSSGLSVEDQALLAAMQAFESHRERWTSTYKKLQGIVEQVEKEWQGQASNAFRGAADHLQTAAAQTAQDLQAIEEKLKSASVVYQRMEEENAHALNVPGLQ